MKKLAEMEEVINSSDLADISITQRHEEELINLFQDVLKTEWERVKSGEIGFRLAKWGLIILVVGALVLSVCIELSSSWKLGADTVDAEFVAEEVVGFAEGGVGVLGDHG